MKVEAVNSQSESSFGALAWKMTQFGTIGLQNAGGISQLQRNQDFSRGIYTGKTNRKRKGLYFSFHIYYIVIN